MHQSMFPRVLPRQETWLFKARTAFSMCSGAGTAEAAPTVLQRITQEYPVAGNVEMDIKTVALWDS